MFKPKTNFGNGSGKIGKNEKSPLPHRCDEISIYGRINYIAGVILFYFLFVSYF